MTRSTTGSSSKTVINPPVGPTPAPKPREVPSPAAETPRRTKTVDGVTYVLVNGGWRREARKDDG